MSKRPFVFNELTELMGPCALNALHSLLLSQNKWAKVEMKGLKITND